jgi:hypothetical protein
MVIRGHDLNADWEAITVETGRRGECGAARHRDQEDTLHTASERFAAGVDEKGSITVRTCRSQGPPAQAGEPTPMVAISIIDTRLRIPEKNLKRILDPFSR